MLLFGCLHENPLLMLLSFVFPLLLSLISFCFDWIQHLDAKNSHVINYL